MLYRNLSNTGLKIGSLSFGSWVTFKDQVDLKLACELMSYAYDNGVNFFDNAEVYAKGQSEIIMGEALKKLNWRRSSYLVSTKLFWGLNENVNEQNTLNRKYLIEGINGSLKRLNLDYVDILYCHRPDPDTPVAETVQTMSDIIASGKALYWGTSMWPAESINEAFEVAYKYNLRKPIVEQPQYNVFHRTKVEDEFKDLYKKYNLALTTWSPLASGLLTGKYLSSVPSGSRLSLENYAWLKERLLTPENNEKVLSFTNIAKQMGCTPSQLAILWCLQNQNVSSVILGATKLEQLKEIMEFCKDPKKIPSELMIEIDKLRTVGEL